MLARQPHTAAALRVANESLRRKIRRVECIADQDAGTLQIYLFELDLVTVKALQAIARVFTYTEADVHAQLDKLGSAYDVAEWSESHFNNRALFCRLLPQGQTSRNERVER